MKLSWFGHSCFGMEWGDGRKLLFDPYNDAVGYIVPEWTADIVLVSHRHFDHANVSAVKSDCSILREPGRFVFDGITVTGIDSYHDEQGGAAKGKNTIFVVEAEGIRICHCGDLGHILPEKTIAQIGRVDYLLLPVGGLYTVDGAKAALIAAALAPRAIIPMHYKTDVCKIGFDSIDGFLNHVAWMARTKTESTIELKDSDAGILLMDHQC